MPVRTSWVARRSYTPLFSVVLALLALAGCGSAKPLVVCNASNGASCSCGGPGTSLCPAQFSEVLYSVGGTSSTGLQFQIFPLNSATGTLGSPATQSNVDLGVMAITPSGQFYYAAEGSGIYGYSIGATGVLTALAGSPFPANLFNPLAIIVDPTSKFLYISDTYHSSLAGFAIDSSSSALSAVPNSPFPNNSYTNRAAFTPSGNFLYVVDGGSDTGIAGVSGYSVNRTTGSLTPISGGTFTYSAFGSEYFDVAVHPSGQFLYFTETDGIHAFNIDQSTGALTQISSGPLAPLPSPMQLTMNSSGAVLYAAVGGQGTIAAYSVNPSTGALTEVAGSPYQVNPSPAPANVLFSFTLDPRGEFLYAQGQNGSIFGIVEFSVDSGTGALAQLGILSDAFPSGPGKIWPLPFSAVQLP
jgi:6-phosphogluconolactonase